MNQLAIDGREVEPSRPATATAGVSDWTAGPLFDFPTNLAGQLALTTDDTEA